uniref:Uncharacterized protein n=1 Tax=Physcomitrium patens TaxID=3218 RepID=A0A7I4AXZ7_PHYPA
MVFGVISGIITVVSSAMANEDDVEDVKDLSLVDGEGETSPEKNAAVEFLRRGNRDFRNSRFKEAILCYTKALNANCLDQAMLYSNRCAAYCNQGIRLRPARTSEESAMLELDPMTLGQLALKDSEKLVKLQSDNPKAYLRKATAQVLLEQYEAAVETYLSGLEIDPMNKPLQEGLREVKILMEGVEQNDSKRRKLKRSDDLDCTLCLKLLHQPITTPCGHSFCRACLLQALDHGNKCPMCRTVIFVSPKTYPVSVTLNNLIQRNFPEEFAERKAEMDAVSLAGGETLPLFVMDVVLPMQQLMLNIFEPRYRLMIRRVVEGNHRMGMVRIEESGSLAEVACEVEITECEPLPDGRFEIEVVGKRRFRMTETWEQDGYRVAKVQWLQDVVHPDGSPEKDELAQSVRTAADLVNAFISRVRDIAVRSDRRLLEMLNRTEGMPSASDPERFSFWVANLMNIPGRERLQYLRITDTRERLTREITRLRSMPADSNCCIQ